MIENTELLLALKELKKLTGMTMEVHADTEEERKEAVEQIRCLCSAYKEKYDKTFFLQNILQETMFEADICRQALRFHVPLEESRILYLLEGKSGIEESSINILKHIFPVKNKVLLIPVSENRLAILASIETEEDWHENAQGFAHMVIDTLNAEAFLSVSVSCSIPFFKLVDLPQAYRQAQAALKIGRLFNDEKRFFYYDQLGVDRLVYHLPDHVRDDFLNEIWKNQVPEELDMEVYSVVSCFMQNNLNIAETARQLHMHRNTLIYRIEKVQAMTGLDIRYFEHAMTFKLALMIMNYNKKREGEREDE